MQTIQGFETGFSNTVVAGQDGYYLLESTYPYPNPGSQDLLVSYFNNCHEHLWSNTYVSGTDIQVEDALIHNNQLIILAGSGNKYPLLLTLGLDGERLSCFNYQNSTFDNHFNLQLYNDSYHIFGPSDGPSHFAIDENGEIIFANVLRSNLSAAEVGAAIPFGCTILSNGQSIRRFGNVIIAVNYNQEILWAHQFGSALGYAISERKPMEVEGGFVMLMQIDNSMSSLVKFDYDGQVVWNTKALNISAISVPLNYQEGIISMVSRTDFLDENRLALVEIEESSGEVITSQYFEFEAFNEIVFPSHTRTAKGDYVITGSVTIDFSNGEWEDLVFINPQDTECHQIFNNVPSIKPDINFTDVTDEFEIIEVFPEVTTQSLFLFEEEAIFYDKCIASERVELDTSLNCSNIFVYDNPFPGAKYSWSDGLKDSIRIFDSATDIELIIDDCGERRELSLHISESHCDCQLFLPNIIDMHSDNPQNNALEIFSNCDMEEYSIHIFDRWGNLVFYSEDRDELWMEDSNGENLSEGVYAYRIDWTYAGRVAQEQRWGTVTLVR